MIIVEVEPKKHKMKLSGHADHAEPGEDVVCAAASMLFYALCETVTSYPKKVFTRKPLIDVKDPRCICRPRKEYKANFDIIYQTILNGYILLEQNYPDNVKIIVKD